MFGFLIKLGLLVLGVYLVALAGTGFLVALHHGVL